MPSRQNVARYVGRMTRPVLSFVDLKLKVFLMVSSLEYSFLDDSVTAQELIMHSRTSADLTG